MHLLTLAAFAFLFYQAEDPGRWAIVGEHDVAMTLLIVLGQPLLLALAATLATRKVRQRLDRFPDTSQVAYQLHHHSLFVLRIFAAGGFAVSVFLTRWPAWFAFERIFPPLQMIGDFLVLLPFFAALIVIWVAAYPMERAVPGDSDSHTSGPFQPNDKPLTIGAYLDFHIRHEVFIVAAPMAIILFSADMTRAYRKSLAQWLGWSQAPDMILGCVAAAVFILAPVMLRRIWRTHSLAPGPIRDRLQAICARIGLRCRDILVWRSGGLMINAAVMGLVAPVRYILLSDALLDTMEADQIEAVFGHEAGHVKHRHIQHFLIFAYVGWLVVTGIMEGVSRLTGTSPIAGFLPSPALDGIVVGLTGIVWLLGFGWLSRRFERQADLFGARCVATDAAHCVFPCSVHPDAQTEVSSATRVCMAGATIYTSALDRVASLNGIPQEEHSWRHSSIGSRIRFLISLAGDPNRALRFNKSLQRIKGAMITAAVVGSALGLYYWWSMGQPATEALRSASP